MLGVASHPHQKETAVLDTISRPGWRLQSAQDGDLAPPRAAGLAARPPDPAQVADAVARYQAYQGLREFRAPASQAIADVDTDILIARWRISDQIHLMPGGPEVGEHSRVRAAGHDQMNAVKPCEQPREHVDPAAHSGFIHRVHEEHDWL
jgi:hypothetical protein